MFTPFAIYGGVAAPAPPPSFDPDAAAFFAAVTGGGDTLTSTEENAVNDLVVGLKADGIWTKFDALYPLVGGTATSTKWNLKDPRDLDAAFRITWYGGWTFSSDGAEGDGTSTGGDTHYNPFNNATNNDFHWSLYVNGGTDTTVADYDFGGFASGNDWILTMAYNNASAPFTHYVNFNGFGYLSIGQSTARGMLIGLQDPSATNTTQLYKNATRIINSAQTQNNVNMNLGLGCSWRSGVTDPSARRFALASIGYGLDTVEAPNFYSRVQTFQTALSRQA
jgi:hypothetical protein